MTGPYSFRTWLKYSALTTSAPLSIEEDRVTVASFLKRIKADENHATRRTKVEH